MVRANVWISAVGVWMGLGAMACERTQLQIPVVQKGARADSSFGTNSSRGDSHVVRTTPPVPSATGTDDRAARRECRDPADLARWIVQQWGRDRFETVRQRLRQMESLVKFAKPYRPITRTRGRPLGIESRWSAAVARYGAYRRTGRTWVLSDREAAVSVEFARGSVDVFFSINSQHRTTPSGARQFCARLVSRWNLYVRSRRVDRRGVTTLLSLLAKGAFTEAVRTYYRYPRGHMLVSVQPRHLQKAWEALIKRKGRFLRLLRLVDGVRDGAGRPTLIARCAFEKGVAEIRFPPPSGRNARSFLWGYPQFPE